MARTRKTVRRRRKVRRIRKLRSTRPAAQHIREENSNKGNFGKVLVIGGSRGKSGAAAMTGQAALRSGAGLVTIAKGDVRNGNEAAAGIRAEINDPAIICARIRGLQRQVLDVFSLPRQAQGRIDERLVEAILIEERETLLESIEPNGAWFT